MFMNFSFATINVYYYRVTSVPSALIAYTYYVVTFMNLKCILCADLMSIFSRNISTEGYTYSTDVLKSNQQLTLLRQRFFATFAGNGGGGEMAPRHMSSSRQNSNGYTYVFGVKLSSSGTSDFVGRRCVLEI